MFIILGLVGMIGAVYYIQNGNPSVVMHVINVQYQAIHNIVLLC